MALRSQANARSGASRAHRPSTGRSKTRNARAGKTSRSQWTTQGRTRSSLDVEPIQAQVEELLLQALETELGGIQVYTMALECARDEELKEEWTKYLEQTRNHERILNEVFAARGMDTQRGSAGRDVVRHLGESMVEAMRMAKRDASPAAAELVAAECVVLAETKDHQNWELLGEVAKALGAGGSAIKEAHDEVEDEEDEHLYHTMGWSRELWLQSLGLHAVLPPPEEKKDVKTAIGAAKAKAGRKKMRST